MYGSYINTNALYFMPNTTTSLISTHTCWPSQLALAIEFWSHRFWLEREVDFWARGSSICFFWEEPTFAIPQSDLSLSLPNFSFSFKRTNFREELAVVQIKS